MKGKNNTPNAGYMSFTGSKCMKYKMQYVVNIVQGKMCTKTSFHSVVTVPEMDYDLEAKQIQA